MITLLGHALRTRTAVRCCRAFTTMVRYNKKRSVLSYRLEGRSRRRQRPPQRVFAPQQRSAAGDEIETASRHSHVHKLIGLDVAQWYLVVEHMLLLDYPHSPWSI